MNERFVNNDVLRYLCRPQYRYGCAIAALTSVVNYLYAGKLGVVTQERLAEELGLKILDIGTKIDPSNDDIMEWFDRFVRERKLRGRAKIFCDRRKRLDFSALRHRIVSPRSILIYHLENHYNIVCGYFGSATDPREAYSNGGNTETWLLLADHMGPPLWARSWQDVLKSFRRHTHCLMLFES